MMLGGDAEAARYPEAKALGGDSGLQIHPNDSLSLQST